MSGKHVRIVRAARTAAVAVACCAAVAGGAVVLQAAVLDAPPRSSLLASDLLRRLEGYRLVDSVDWIGARRFRGVCYQGWFRVRGRRTRKVLGAGLLLDGRTRVVEEGGAILVPPRERALARLELRLACPRVLERTLGDRLARGDRISLARVRRGYLLSFRTRRQRIAYLAAPGSLAPLAMAVHAPFADGRSVLRDGGLTRAKLRALRRTFAQGPHRRPYAYPA